MKLSGNFMQSNAEARDGRMPRTADKNMKALTWKAMFASMNPSPVFEVVAMFGERLAIDGDESCSNELAASGDSAIPKRRANDRSLAKEADLSSRRLATWGASRPTRNALSVRM